MWENIEEKFTDLYIDDFPVTEEEFKILVDSIEDVLVEDVKIDNKDIPDIQLPICFSTKYTKFFNKDGRQIYPKLNDVLEIGCFVQRGGDFSILRKTAVITEGCSKRVYLEEQR